MPRRVRGEQLNDVLLVVLDGNGCEGHFYQRARAVHRICTGYKVITKAFKQQAMGCMGCMGCSQFIEVAFSISICLSISLA